MSDGGKLENCLVEAKLPLTYYLSMINRSFRDRVIAAMQDAGINKTELHKKSGVPYHTIDKFLKREGASTSADNAKAMALSLGIRVDDDASYDELKLIYDQLDTETKLSLLKVARALAPE